MIGLSTIVAIAIAPDAAGIDWDAPPTCPSLQEVHRRIVEQLGDAAVDLETMDVRARVLEPEDGGAAWRLHIQLAGAGVREIEGRSCDALVDAFVVMVAISVTSQREAAVPEPPPPAVKEPSEPSEPPAKNAEPDVAPTRPPEGREPPIRRSDAPPFGSPRALLGVAAGVHGVGLPAIGGGLGGRVGVLWGPLRAAAYGTHWFRRERPVVDDVAAAYRLGVGGLELCGVLAVGREPASFDLLACGEAEVGLLRAEGVRAVPGHTKRHAWWAFGGGIGAMWAPRSLVAFGVRADVMAPVTRYRFEIGTEPAGTSGPVDARGTVVVEFRVPARRR